MDVTTIASIATSLQSARTTQEVSIAVLKKALDTEAAGAAALLQAIPPAPAANLPSHLGQHVNTTA
jgi:hypothetical protein